VQCPACQLDNPPEARFCMSCATALARLCAGCNADLPEGARFCSQCAHPVEAPTSGPSAPPARDPRDYTPNHLADKILRSKSAIEGERKQVTVLFADVKGSLELAEQVDPEEWHRILERFFQILADGVHRFEGTINQYTGDGIMALFGAPIAHEDHAQRACYAALHLREELRRYADELRLERGLDFSVRMGLNSGEVIVGKIGDDLRMDYTAQGSTVGLAARMEKLAAPNAIALTAHTADLVSGYFALRDLGSSQVRGVSAPVRVFELERPGELRTRFEVARARGLTRFVGRERDMQSLAAALASAREGNGQVVGVVAQAGIGKSRLCFEFLERCRADGLRVLEGHAVAHGKNVPLLPMLQVFRAYYGITERDDDQTAREKIAGRLLLIDEDFRDLLPLLFEFFGVPDPERPAPPMDPEARQRQLFGVLRRIIQGRDAHTADVTLIEDLHWIDAASEAFLEQWVEAAAGGRGLLLVNFRPEYHAPWMQKSYYHQLPLALLGVEAIRELLADLLGSDPSLEGLAETIHERARGNPFFTEEVVRSLIESGHLEGDRGRYRLAIPVEKLSVPDSVQSVLAARIDRLPEREKQVLQRAAVIGKQFPEAILEAVAELPRRDLDDALAALERGEFLYEQTLYPVVEYAFKHPLTQEVALHSQLRERRSGVHAAVSRAIEAASGTKLDEQAALLAHHWEEAGEVRQAVRWYRRAAEWVGSSDPVEGVRHWQKVRALAREHPGDSELAACRLEACCAALNIGGWRLGISEEEFQAIFTEGRRLATERGDRIAEALLLLARATRLGTGGNPEAYYRGAREAEALLTGVEDRDVMVAVKNQRAYSAYLLGYYAEALDQVREIREVSGDDLFAGVRIIGYSPSAWTWSFEGDIRAQCGDISSFCDLHLRGVALAREAGLSENLAYALINAPLVALLAGDSDLAGLPDPERAGVEAVELADALSNRFASALALLVLGMAHLSRGRFEDAVERIDEHISMAQKWGVGPEWEAWALAGRSAARLGAGDAEGARQDAESAVAAAEARKTRGFGIWAELALARACLADPGADGDAATRALDRAEALVEETGARGLAPQILEVRARLAGLRGDDAAAERQLREAHRLYREVGAVGHAKRLAAELALS
jgi:class 3 adenylate cyclase